MPQKLVSISPFEDERFDSQFKFQIFDIRYDNELAHEYYGSGKMLAERYAIIEHNLLERG